MDLLKAQEIEHFKEFCTFFLIYDVGHFSSFHEERKARLLMDSLVPRSEGALFLATSLLQ
jgi:hypothetical protein